MIARHLKRRNVPNNILSVDAVELLMRHEWPGNVRELANALEHAVILSDGQAIVADDLPSSLSQSHRKLSKTTPDNFVAASLSEQPARTLHEMEREMIVNVLNRHRGDKPKAAAELGIALKTLYNKLNQYQSDAAAHAG